MGFTEAEADYLRKMIDFDNRKPNDFAKVLWDKEFLVNHHMTFKEIGNELGITENEVISIFYSALRKIKLSSRAKQLKEYIEYY